MEQQGPPPPDLLHFYCRDRRRLLRFVLNSSSSSSSSAVAGLDLSSLSDAALDSVSVDYVIRCRMSSELVLLPESDSAFCEALNHICGLLDDSIRDLVVLSICRSSMEAYLWVLLEGGPSRAFSNSDVTSMKEDFNLLKLKEKDFLGLRSSKKLHMADRYCTCTLTRSTMTKPIVTHVPEDAYVLIRVLRHKKDREASKFLKQHYELPMSSEYDESTSRESSGASGLISDIIERSSSFRLTEKGQKS